MELRGLTTIDNDDAGAPSEFEQALDADSFTIDPSSDNEPTPIDAFLSAEAKNDSKDEAKNEVDKKNEITLSALGGGACFGCSVSDCLRRDTVDACDTLPEINIEKRNILDELLNNDDKNIVFADPIIDAEVNNAEELSLANMLAEQEKNTQEKIKPSLKEGKEGQNQEKSKPTSKVETKKEVKPPLKESKIAKKETKENEAKPEKTTSEKPENLALEEVAPANKPLEAKTKAKANSGVEKEQNNKPADKIAKTVKPIRAIEKNQKSVEKIIKKSPKAIEDPKTKTAITQEANNKSKAERAAKPPATKKENSAKKNEIAKKTSPVKKASEITTKTKTTARNKAKQIKHLANDVTATKFEAPSPSIKPENKTKNHELNSPATEFIKNINSQLTTLNKLSIRNNSSLEQTPRDKHVELENHDTERHEYSPFINHEVLQAKNSPKIREYSPGHELDKVAHKLNEHYTYVKEPVVIKKEENKAEAMVKTSPTSVEKIFFATSKMSAARNLNESETIFFKRKSFQDAKKRLKKEELELAKIKTSPVNKAAKEAIVIDNLSSMPENIAQIIEEGKLIKLQRIIPKDTSSEEKVPAQVEIAKVLPKKAEAQKPDDDYQALLDMIRQTPSITSLSDEFARKERNRIKNIQKNDNPWLQAELTGEDAQSPMALSNNLSIENYGNTNMPAKTTSSFFTSKLFKPTGYAKSMRAIFLGAITLDFCYNKPI